MKLNIWKIIASMLSGVMLFSMATPFVMAENITNTTDQKVPVGRLTTPSKALAPETYISGKMNEQIELKAMNNLNAKGRQVATSKQANLLFPISADSSNDVVYKTVNYVFDNYYYNIYVTKNNNGDYYLNFVSIDVKNTSDYFFKQQKLRNKNFFANRLRVINNDFIYSEYVEKGNGTDEEDSIIIYNKNTNHEWNIKGKAEKGSLEYELLKLREEIGSDMCKKYEKGDYKEFEYIKWWKSFWNSQNNGKIEGFSWGNCISDNTFWQKESVKELNKKIKNDKNDALSYMEIDRWSDKSPWYSIKLDWPNTKEDFSVLWELSTYAGTQIFLELDKSLISPTVDMNNVSYHLLTNGNTYYFFNENLRAEWYPHEYVFTLNLDTGKFWYYKIKEANGKPHYYFYNNGQDKLMFSVYPNRQSNEFLMSYSKSSRINQDKIFNIVSLNSSFTAEKIFATSIKQHSDIGLNTLAEDIDNISRAAYSKHNQLLFVRKEVNWSKTFFFTLVKNDRAKTLLVYNNRLNKIFEYKDIIDIKIDSENNSYLIFLTKKITEQIKKFIYKLNIETAENNIIYETNGWYKITKKNHILETQEDSFIIEGETKIYQSWKGLININKNDKIVFSPKGFFYAKYQFDSSNEKIVLTINDKDIIDRIAQKLGVKRKEIKGIGKTIIADNGYLWTQVTTQTIEKVKDWKKFKEKKVNNVFYIILNDKEVAWVKKFSEKEKEDNSFFNVYVLEQDNVFAILNSKDQLLEVIDPINNKDVVYKIPDKLHEVLSGASYKILLKEDFTAKEQLAGNILFFSKGDNYFFVNGSLMVVLTANRTVFYNFSNILKAFFDWEDLFLLGEYRWNDKVNLSVFRNNNLLLTGLSDIKELEITPFKNYMIIDVVKDNNRIINIEKTFIDYIGTIPLKKYLDSMKENFKRSYSNVATEYIDSVFETFYLNFLNIKDKNHLLKSVSTFISSLDKITK